LTTQDDQRPTTPPKGTKQKRYQHQKKTKTYPYAMTQVNYTNEKDIEAPRQAPTQQLSAQAEN